VAGNAIRPVHADLRIPLRPLWRRVRALAPARWQRAAAVPALRRPRAAATALRVRRGRGHPARRLWRARLRLLVRVLRLPRSLRAAVLGFALFGAGCSPAYVVRAGLEEAKILARRRPIPDVIADPETPPDVRGKLELVLEVREFARRDLGLDAGRSFRDYSELDRDTLALVLSASPPDRLVPLTWWFPIVGRVPYLGFFDPEDAREKQSELEAEGYDTYLRPTSAFSTLGWLPDPLLSTALRYDSLGLAETVVHELTHSTWFVRGHVPFNESLANFVGHHGAAAFFCLRKADPALCREARDRWHDAVLLSEVYDALADSLQALYDRGLPREQVLVERRALLERFQARHETETAPRLRSSAASPLDLTRLNNAAFLARRFYYHRLRAFDDAAGRHDDLAAFLDRLGEALGRVRDPWAALDSLRAPRLQS
jgi:predicted aminopeptidase